MGGGRLEALPFVRFRRELSPEASRMRCGWVVQVVVSVGVHGCLFGCFVVVGVAGVGWF